MDVYRYLMLLIKVRGSDMNIILHIYDIICNTYLFKGQLSANWKATFTGITSNPTAASANASDPIKYMPTLCSCLFFQMITITTKLPTIVTRITARNNPHWRHMLAREFVAQTSVTNRVEFICRASDALNTIDRT